MIGTQKSTPILSIYQPPAEIKEVIPKIKQDYQIGLDIQQKPFTQFGDETSESASFLVRMERDQKAFNNYIPAKSAEISEMWRENGIRPVTRNKIISMAAHLRAAMLYPGFFAQNDSQEEDKVAAKVMREMMMFNIQNSDYELVYLFAIIAALVNPVAYINCDYIQAFQKIKIARNDGEIGEEEAVDRILSGFQIDNVPAEEILLTNAYTFNIQKQRALLRRRLIDYDEAEAMHGNHDYFKFVRPSVRLFMSDNDGMFYEETDDGQETLVEELTYYNRREDMEIPFINGVYLGKPRVSANRIKHRDNKNYPKYPFVKFGFEPVDEKRFAFYKSLVHKMGPDQSAANKWWRIISDSGYLNTFPPVAITGQDKYDASISVPASVHAFKDKDTKITPIRPNSDITAGWNILKEIESSQDQSSQDDIRAGIETAGSKTAYEIAKIEKNAIIQLGIPGAMIADCVKQIGDLVKDIIINHQTIGEMQDITNPAAGMKYMSYLVSNITEKGKGITRKIRFTDNLTGLTVKDKRTEERRILKEEGGLNADTKIIDVNPAYFSKLDFQAVIQPEEWLPESQRFKEAMEIQGFDRFINNPFVDQQELTRKGLEIFYKGDTDKLMKKMEQAGMQMQQIPQQQQAPIRQELVGDIKGQ